MNLSTHLSPLHTPKISTKSGAVHAVPRHIAPLRDRRNPVAATIPKKIKFQNQTSVILVASKQPPPIHNQHRRASARRRASAARPHGSGNRGKPNISVTPPKLRNPPPPAWSCRSRLSLSVQQSPSRLHRRSHSPIIATRTSPTRLTHARNSQPPRASSPLPRYPVHRRGSSEATSGLGGRRAKKPPSLRLATAPSSALAEPLHAERYASPRTLKSHARQTCPRTSWPAATHTHSLPGTYLALTAQLAPSPLPACGHLRAPAAAGVNGGRPRARPRQRQTPPPPASHRPKRPHHSRWLPRTRVPLRERSHLCPRAPHTPTDDILGRGAPSTLGARSQRSGPVASSALHCSHGAFAPRWHPQAQPASQHAGNGWQPRNRALRRHRNQTSTPTLQHAPTALAAPTRRPLHIAQRRQQPRHRALRCCRITGTRTQPSHSSMSACAFSCRVPHIHTDPAVALA